MSDKEQGIHSAAEPIIDYINALCERLRVEPLEQSETLAIIEETGLALQTRWQELGRHLANLKTMVFHHYQMPHERERNAEERKAFSKFQRLVKTLSIELRALSDPATPQSRALSKAAFSTVSTKEPQTRSLSRMIKFIDSEPVESAERKLQEDIEFTRTAIARMSRYTDQAFPKVTVVKSAARWNTIYVGEVLPALFEYHFRRPFGISWQPTTRELSGPGIRFLGAATRAIGILRPGGKPYSSSTLVGYWHLARSDPLPRTDWINNTALKS